MLNISRLRNNVARAFTGPSWPKGMDAAAKKQREAHLDESGKPKLTRISDGRELDLGNTTRQNLPAGSFRPLMAAIKNRPDAGNAVIAPDNGAIATLRYVYGTHKSMEAWVTERPPNGKLKLNMIISPSIHAGSDRASKLKNFEKFSKTNIYNLEVVFPDGTSEKMRFDVDGNKDPARGYEAQNAQHATLSPDFEIDLDKYKGQDVKIRGWADGSAGVGGYQERRETILHL